jgi:hypothetical protein
LRACSLLLALILILLAAGNALAQGLFVNPMQSPRQANELDTADSDGQAGGEQLGINYQLVNLRCQTGEVIVALRIRRGDVLDFVQVGCATPRCGNRGCTWSGTPNWEMWAGNPDGGDPHPDMICGPSQMVSGFRGRVVTFVPAGAAGFDYAADLEIKCSRMIAPPNAAGFNQVSQFGSDWHHPEGALGGGYIPPNVVSNVNTPMISCPNGWGATAISVGTADFVDSRVVQAVSMFCPNTPAPPPGPRCPDNLIVLDQQDQYPAVENQWFPSGGRTGGGAIIEMGVLPSTQNWDGTHIVEAVTGTATTCHIAGLNPANICGMGAHLDFVVGAAVTVQPNNLMRFAWPQGGGQGSGAFPDFHFVFDTNGGAPAGVDLLHGAAACTVTCLQNYTCGDRTYGPFTITYTFSPDNFADPYVTFVHPGASVAVTKVTVTKH